METDDGGPQNKRRRDDDGLTSEIEERLETLIVKVGDKGSSSIESNLKKLADVLEADLTTYKPMVLEILQTCVIGMPDKLTVYSTLAGLLNAKDYNFGGELVEMTLRNLRTAMQRNEFDTCLIIVTFISDLVNCNVVSAHSCLNFLEVFAEAATESDVPQVRTDWFAYAVLHSLVFAGRALSERKAADVEALMEQLKKYLDSRHKLHVPMLRVWNSNRPHQQEDYLDCMAAQIREMAKERWTEKQLIRYYLAFEDRLTDALQHNMPGFVPVAHSAAQSSYPLPRVVFRLFDYTDCPEDGPMLPGAHSVERFIIEEELGYVIDRHSNERKECGTALLAYQKQSRIPLNYCILEVIFGQLFMLPASKHLELLYGSLLIELCKLQPNTMPQVLAQAAELLYQRADTMQPICVDRLVDWFSYHLANFQFRWSWSDWADCLRMNHLSPKQLLVREILEKCMRFSYHKRLTDILPDGFEALILSAPKADYKFAREECLKHPGTSFAHQLSQSIRNKCTPAEAIRLLGNCPRLDERQPNLLAVEIFTATLLNLGSKSFSHSFAALTKYHEVLRHLTANSEDAQLTVLVTLYDLWKTKSQMMVVLIDKLLKMQIVECNVVVSWIFSDEMKPEFLRMWVWETMQGALVKLSRHVHRLRTELEARQQQRSQKQNVVWRQMIAEAEDDGAEGDEESEPAKPESETIEEMAIKLAGAEEFQKNLLLSVFHKFTILLIEHLLQSETEGKDWNTHWYRLVSGRFRQMFLAQYEEASKQIENLEAYLFTSDVDPHILEIFHQFCSLKR